MGDWHELIDNSTHFPRHRSRSVFDPAAELNRMRESEGYDLVEVKPGQVAWKAIREGVTDWELLRSRCAITADQLLTLKAHVLGGNHGT